MRPADARGLFAALELISDPRGRLKSGDELAPQPQNRKICRRFAQKSLGSPTPLRPTP